MTETTAGDLWRLREQLERDAAATLGRVLFAFSRLDTSIGLMVASVLRVSGKEDQLPKVDEMSLDKRLKFLEAYVRDAIDVRQQGRSELAAWLADAHNVRLQRNQLVHGRWDVDPSRQKILNVLSLPSTGTNQVAEYTLSELQSVVDTIQNRHAALSELRFRWAFP